MNVVADPVPQRARRLADHVAGQVEIVLHLAERAVEVVVLEVVVVGIVVVVDRQGAGGAGRGDHDLSLIHISEPTRPY